jgi:hypothetical protein
LKPRSPTNERPPEPSFFVDENLCGIFSARLRVAGLRIEERPTIYPKGTKDTVWLPFVGNQGWIALTMDLFKEDPEEQLALIVHGVPVFVLVGQATQHQRADVFPGSSSGSAGPSQRAPSLSWRGFLLRPGTTPSCRSTTSWTAMREGDVSPG